MKGELWLGSLGLRTLGRDCVSRVVVVGRALSPPKNGSLLRDSAFWAFIWVCCLQKEGRGRWRWQDEASPFQARQLLTGARPLTVASPSIYLPLQDPLLPLRTCQPSVLFSPACACSPIFSSLGGVGTPSLLPRCEVSSPLYVGEMDGATSRRDSG